MKSALFSAFILMCSLSYAQELHFDIRDQVFQTGDHVVAEFSVTGFDSIVDYQFAMQFNTSVLKFDSIHVPVPEAIPLLPTDNWFGLYQIDLGQIRTVWGAWGPKWWYTLDDGTVIFSVHFTALQAGELSGSFAIAPQILQSAADRWVLQGVPVSFAFIAAKTSSEYEPDNENVVYPNPCEANTDLTVQGYDGYSFSLYDIAGRQMYSGVINDDKTKIMVATGMYFGVISGDTRRVFRLVVR